MRSVLSLTGALLLGSILPGLPLANGREARFEASRGQDAAMPAKPTEHLVGSIVSADAAGQTVTLKEDGSGLEHLIQLQNTRTLLKVSPGAKDLKSATRITAADLAPGDRVDVRGSKVESDPNAVAARSVVLMSSRELQQAHQNEASAWQRSTGGTVTAIDAASKKLTLTVRGPEGAKPVIVDTTAAVFTRYSPEHPKSANPSQFGDVQPGDQVKIIGEKSADGTTIAALKVYSGSFKTIAGTVTSIASDGKSLVVKDLATKQAVTVSLTDDSGLHKLPPMMAMMLARRFNPDAKNVGPGGSPAGGPGAAPAPGPGSPAGGSTGSASAAGAPPYGAKAGEAGSDAPGARPAQRMPDGGTPGPGGPDGPGGPRGGRMAGGDLSQMMDRLPKITTADLKPGDAVVVSGSPSASSKSTLLATSVIAGVEPILQSATTKQAQSLGDWGASLGGGGDAGAPPQ